MPKDSEPKRKLAHTVRQTIYAIAAALLTAAILYGLHLLRRAFVADRFVIPSESMEPTLVPGDAVWVNKLLMGARIYTDFHFDKKRRAAAQLPHARIKTD